MVTGLACPLRPRAPVSMANSHSTCITTDIWLFAIQTYMRALKEFLRVVCALICNNTPPPKTVDSRQQPIIAMGHQENGGAFLK